MRDWLGVFEGRAVANNARVVMQDIERGNSHLRRIPSSSLIIDQLRDFCLST